MTDIPNDDRCIYLVACKYLIIWDCCQLFSDIFVCVHIWGLTSRLMSKLALLKIDVYSGIQYIF